MRRLKLAALRTLRGLMLALLVALFVALGALYAALRTGPGQELAVAVVLDRLRTQLAGNVRVGGVAASPDLSGSLGLLEVQFTDSRGGTVLRADSVRIRYSLLGLLRGRYEISQLDAWGPDVRIERMPDGSMNVQHVLLSPDPTAPMPSPLADSVGTPGRVPAKLVIRNVTLHGAQVRIDRGAGDKADRIEIRNLNARLPEVWIGTQNGDHVEIETASLVFDPKSRNLAVSDIEG